jgi:hypothetical protein
MEQHTVDYTANYIFLIFFAGLMIYTWYRFKQQEPQWKKMLGKK